MKFDLPKNKISLADIIVILLLALIPFSMFIVKANSNSDAKYAVIKTTDGEYSYTLEKDNEFEIKSGECTYIVKIEDGKIEIVDSDCNEQICVATGPISTSQDVITCIPGKLIIRIVSGGENSDLDWIAG